MMRHCRYPLSLLLTVILAAGCVHKLESLHESVGENRSRAYESWIAKGERDGRSQLVLGGSLSVDDALSLALANNKNIQIAVEEKARAKGQLRQGFSEMLPSLTGEASYNRTSPRAAVAVDANGNPIRPSRNVYNSTLTFSQPLYHGGSIFATIRSGQINALLADERVRGVVEAVSQAVAQSYYDVLLAIELYKVNKSALDSAQNHLDDVLKRKNAGVATQLDVLRAQVEVSNVHSDVIAQNNAIGLGKAQLLKLMGVSQQSEVELGSRLEYRPIKPLFEAAVKMAYENRPDLYFSELDIRLQREAVALAKSRRFPFLDFFYRYTWGRPDPNQQQDDSWGTQSLFGLNASWTFFDGFQREGQIAEQEALMRQRAISLADTEEQALLELRQALISIRDAEQVLEAQKVNVERAKEGLRLAQVGFPEVTTEVEVTDARAALVRAEGLFWQAVHTHVVARLSLQKAMGLLAPAPGSSEVPKAAPEPGDIPQFMANGAARPDALNPTEVNPAAPATVPEIKPDPAPGEKPKDTTKKLPRIVPLF